MDDVWPKAIVSQSQVVLLVSVAKRVDAEDKVD